MKRTSKKRKPSPRSVHDRAYRRGMVITKARHGGWTVALIGRPEILYATHDWSMIVTFVGRRPILIRRAEAKALSPEH